MNEQKLPNIFLGSEDLVFDLKTRTLLKVSNRLKKNFGDHFILNVKTLDDFEQFTSCHSGKGNSLLVRNFDDRGDQVFDYTIHLDGMNFLINERSWINQENSTFHSILNFQDQHTIIQVSYPALVDIVEKIENPAILFNSTLTKALVVNAAALPILNPESQFSLDFSIKDIFAVELQFEEASNWVSVGNSLTLTFEAELYLEENIGTWYELRLYKTRPEQEVLVLCILKNISIQKRIEEKLKRTNELIFRVVDVQNHFLSKAEGANPYEVLLSNILHVIDAKLGFVGKVKIDAEGQSVLRIHAATDISSVSDAGYERYHKDVDDNYLFRHFDHLFGACIEESKIILENSPPPNQFTSDRLIPGYPTVENFLGVPIFNGKEIIGLIGLGNKKGGFTDQDITDLKPFITTYSLIIEAYRYEQEKIRFEKESFVKAKILATVADHSSDLIVVMNDMSEFEFISPSASTFFEEGIRVEEVQMNIRLLLKETISPEFKISDERYISRLKLNAKDDIENWVESNVNILQVEGNETVIAVIRDVSAQMNVQKRLIESLNKEKQFNSFVSDFMNIVAHEFKTPLTTIISSMELSKYYLDTMIDLPETSKLKLHYRKVEVELENLQKLVTHSLDYERFVNNSPVLKKENVQLSKFIENILKTHSFFSKIEYHSEVDRKFTAELDKFLIQTSIVNLVSNAIKYGGEKKKPIVRIFQTKNSYGIEVKDFGIGILEKELPYIFTPFFRGTNFRGIPGSGFGLVAVKNFVELHAGVISINSVLHVGTDVIISF